MMGTRTIGLLMGLLLTAEMTRADEAGGYLKAPDAIRQILDMPAPPAVALSPRRDYLILAQRQSYPGIVDLARPILRLAGQRIDPQTNGPQRLGRTRALTLQPLAGGQAIPLELPAEARVSLPVWSPDGRRFALLNTTDSAVELWLGSVDQPKLRRVEGLRINAAYGDELHWLADGKTLLCQAVPADRGEPPAPPRRPDGPVIQQSSGTPAPVRTFQDLLRNPHDEALFVHYATAQLVRVEVDSRRVTPVGKPAVFARWQPAPDGKHLLVVRNERPFSYVLPASAFPKVLEIWDESGQVVHTLARLPLADNVPIEGVPTGPRLVQWRPDRPNTLFWVEALDEGDPRKPAEHRDRVLLLSAPFKAEPTLLARTEQRFAALLWGESGLALLSDYNRDNRHQRTFQIDVDHPEKPARLIWDRSVQDRYGDPGTPLMRRLPTGRMVLRQDGDDLFLVGAGASAQGERPFLDRFHLPSGKSKRLFQSAADCYETVVDVLDDRGSKILTRHESPASPPNYRVRNGESITPLTDFKDPAPQLRKIRRQLVRYKRDDGIPLSFTLYLPPDYKEGTRLPTVVWAYPREFTDPSVAGQVVGSPNRYTTLSGSSHLFFLLVGYAVLDGATMPVVGSPEKANDTFVEQIVASAKAAIDKAVELGVTDPERVGVGGHSYGAFMTANLLAHSDLFRAGIARSGAYNRTLTPFGFQNERRTLWQAPEVYLRVSPFLQAHKINEPILLIHGEVDNNPGTFPIQSERLYQAIRGNGGTVRYVSLPHESHGYQARESIEHVLAEMIGWFDRHVKEAPPRKK